jgi:TctA family transporter
VSHRVAEIADRHLADFPEDLRPQSMDFLSTLALGFGVALTPLNLLVGLAGCALGTLVGVLPGIGPVAAIAMALPATYALAPVTALILLAGMYCGAHYGAAMAAILLKLPGESPSEVTGGDGFHMARQGRAGLALAVAALGAFFAACFGTLMLALVTPMLTQLAMQFGPAEAFSLMVLGMVGTAVMASGALLKALGMVVLGLLLGSVGADANSGLTRFAFDIPELSDGIGFVVLAMGVFGYGEIISNLAQPQSEPLRSHALATPPVHGLWPTRQDANDMKPAVLRGSLIGSVLGVLPGGAGLLAAFAALGLERKIKGKPGEMPLGKGNIRGVAAPASAYSAAAQTAFIPMLALGFPPNAVMALMVGVLTLHKLPPGPQVMASNPELFWGLIAALWLGNLMLVVLNLPLRGVWIRLLHVPYRWLFPAIVLFCAVGVYTSNHSSFDVWLVAAFGIVGYGFHQLDMEPAPLLLGFILAPGMEENLRRALELSGGEWAVFVMRPLSAGLLIAAVCMLFLVLLPAFQSRRTLARVED